MVKIIEWRTKTQFDYGSPEENNVEVIEGEEGTYLALIEKTPGSVDVPFTTPAEYSYDDAKIEVVDGKAKLKASVANDYNWPFTMAGNYNFDAVKIEVTGGVARLKRTPLVPYAWYHLNEFSGIIAFDSSGNGRDGTLFNMGNEDWVAGKLNNCLIFNGVNNYINCGDIANFERTDAFSLEAWFKSDSPTSQVIVARREPVAPKRGWEMFLDLNGRIHFYLISSTDDYLGVFTIEVGYADNTLHHVIVTYDGSSLASGVRIYVDNLNKPLIIGKDTLTSTIQYGESVFIGARGGEFHYFNGLLDEIVIYNQELTSYQVNNRFNEGNGTESMHGVYYIDNPSIYLNTGWAFTSAVNIFTETATKPSGTEIKYQISSDNGVTWKWWDDVAWAAITGGQADSWYYANESNLATDVSTNITSLAGSGTLKFRAFLHSAAGIVGPELDNIYVAKGITYPVGSYEISMKNDIQPTLVISWLTTTEIVTKPLSTDIKYQFSIDSGSSWNGSWFTKLETALKELSLLKDGSDKIRFKFQLSTSKESVTPEIDNLNLTCDRGYETSGYYISTIFNLGAIIWLTSLLYDLSTPSGTSAIVKVRFSDHPLDPESGYIEKVSEQKAWDKETNQFQWRVDFIGNGLATPKLNSLTCNYSSNIAFQQESLAKLDQLAKKHHRITLSKKEKS